MNYLYISEEVQDALDRSLPIVALETTLLAFGLPAPYNRETAFDMEDIVRSQGAIPATIGILDGKLKIGLSRKELEWFTSGHASIRKASSRDIPHMIASGMPGATTISGTMVAAELAGIPVFATGGLGGVHRDGENTLDISLDLIDLARTRIAVVSSGAKAILDLPRTLEYLETQGVPVYGYQTDYFASFYSRQSGLMADYRIDTPEEGASLMHIKRGLGLKGGMLIANPVPEENEIPFDEINLHIQSAIEVAERNGIVGKDITPFLLKEINRSTDSRSLQTNLALVRNNAKVGAQIAVAYGKLLK